MVASDITAREGGAISRGPGTGHGLGLVLQGCRPRAQQLSERRLQLHVCSDLGRGGDDGIPAERARQHLRQKNTLHHQGFPADQLDICSEIQTAHPQPVP